MKNKKRRLEMFSAYDHTGIEAHLERMAEKGWLLESISQFGWVYRRTEPKKLHFAVTYYSKASGFDPEPSEGQKTFHDFCEHSGWMLTAASAQLQVFYNERENPIPIETDPIVEVTTIHNTMKKGFLPSYCMLLIYSFILYGMFFKDPIGLFSRTLCLLLPFGGVMLTLICLVEIIGYLMWYKRAKISAEQGQFLATRSHPCLRHVVSVVVIIATIYCVASEFYYASSFMRMIVVGSMLYMFIFILIVCGIKSFLKRKKVKAYINKRVTLVLCIVLPLLTTGIGTRLLIHNIVNGDYARYEHPSVESYEYEGMTFTAYHDSLPLTVGDLTGNDSDNYSTQWDAQESLLVDLYTAYQDIRHDSPERMPSLKYTITKVKMPALYDICFNNIYDDYNDMNDKDIPEGWKRRLVEVDAKPWSSDAAYQVYRGDEAVGTYLICWDDYIVELDASWQLTNEQMSIIAEKLNGI